MDYDIEMNQATQRIEMVINKTYGPVEFEAQKLDESATMVMGSELKIWTSMI